MMVDIFFSLRWGPTPSACQPSSFDFAQDDPEPVEGSLIARAAALRTLDVSSRTLCVRPRTRNVSFRTLSVSSYVRYSALIFTYSAVRSQVHMCDRPVPPVPR